MAARATYNSSAMANLEPTSGRPAIIFGARGRLRGRWVPISAPAKSRPTGLRSATVEVGSKRVRFPPARHHHFAPAALAAAALPARAGQTNPWLGARHTRPARNNPSGGDRI
jgi:hypothetical protein